MNPIDTVAAYRPNETTLSAEWSSGRRTAVLEKILAEPAVRTGHDLLAIGRARRRWVPAAVIAGAAAAAVVAIGVVLPSGTPGAATSAAAAEQLEKLAVRAEASPADLVGPGQFGHVLETFVQTGASAGTVVNESWTGYDGTIWRRDVNGALGPGVTYLEFPPGAGGSELSWPTPKLLASLPTNVDELNAYLRRNVTGSSSKDEAVFVAVGDLLRGGYAPPALRAAMIRVLELTPHITATKTHDSLGRPAYRIDFVDHAIRPHETETLMFDPNTSAILEEADRNPISSYTGTYTEDTTVDSVPQIVRDRAVLQN
jgi:hypothetical protein